MCQASYCAEQISLIKVTYICQLKVSTYPLSESEVCSNKGEWNRYSKPEGKKSNKGSKRNSCRAPLAPQNQVHHKEQAEHNAATGKFLTLGQVQLNTNTIIYKEPTRCNFGQYCLLTTARTLFMFRMFSAPIIRSTEHCSNSHWCESYCKL